MTSHADSIVPPNGVLVGRAFHHSPPTRFGRVYRGELVEASTVDVLLHANAVHLDTNEAGTAIERVQVASLDGRRVTVGARLFVLATGGVENARLLLASDGVQTSGLGNGSDCVGRFFMDHPQVSGAHLAITSPRGSRDLVMLRDRGAMLCLSPDTQRRHEVLNANVQFLPVDDPWQSEAGGFPLDIQETIQRLDRRALPDAQAGRSTGARGYRPCLVRAESAPRPESRVTLEERETDALGVRRARLHFVMGTLESRTIMHTLEVIAREFGSRQFGRVRLVRAGRAEVPLGDPPWERVGTGNHHMGTTRMSDSPATGVVDSHCQVHGVSNLYVAGSSVFPTCGMANPTFTIVAMALRLAERLTARLRSS